MTRQGGEASLNKRYLIWSNGHRGWWKGNRHGYTTLTHRAGQFSFEDAMEIVTNANRYSNKVEEVMVEAPPREQIDLDLAYPDR
jgi:hypothetical protein